MVLKKIQSLSYMLLTFRQFGSQFYSTKMSMLLVRRIWDENFCEMGVKQSMVMKNRITEV